MAAAFAAKLNQYVEEDNKKQFQQDVINRQREKLGLLKKGTMQKTVEKKKFAVGIDQNFLQNSRPVTGLSFLFLT